VHFTYEEGTEEYYGPYKLAVCKVVEGTHTNPQYFTDVGDNYFYTLPSYTIENSECGALNMSVTNTGL